VQQRHAKATLDPAVSVGLRNRRPQVRILSGALHDSADRVYLQRLLSRAPDPRFRRSEARERSRPIFGDLSASSTSPAPATGSATRRRRSSQLASWTAPTPLIHGIEDALFAYGHAISYEKRGGRRFRARRAPDLRGFTRFLPQNGFGRAPLGAEFACNVCLSRGRGLRAAGEARATGAT
jgi:hypothetical protein